MQTATSTHSRFKASPRWSLLILLAILALIAGGAPSRALAAEPAVAALHVQGTTLADSSGQTVQLRGLSSHGLSWYPQFVNAANMVQMKNQWGCNVFRLAMYTQEYNGYCTGDDANRAALKARIADAVAAAHQAGIYVIIDWHILSDGNPQTHQSEALAFFDEMSRTYGSDPHVLYEICNEPNGSVTWDQVKAYAQAVIPVIRQHSDGIILVGTPTWSQDIDQAAASPLTGVSNVMYTLHFYAATHKDALRNKLVAAVQSGLPVFVSEFGICEASGSGTIDEGQADAWLAVMNQYHISFAMWDFSDKDEACSIIKPNTGKTSGFTTSDLTQTGRWFVSRMATLDGPSSGVTGLSYSCHVQNIGNMAAVEGGQTAGTTGRALRMEAFRAQISGIGNLGITYCAHVQNVGWMGWVSDGQTAGTTGQALRMEALKMKLTGDAADQYDLYYCVHVQNYGWSAWAKNGDPAGSQGLALRAEAVRAVLVEKGGAEPAPLSSQTKALFAKDGGGGGAATGSLSATATMTGSWAEGSQTAGQFAVAIANGGGAVNAWKVTLTFDRAVTLRDNWNGQFSVSGNTLTITNKDYNGTIAAGATYRDLGFILLSDGAPSVTQVSVQ